MEPQFICDFLKVTGGGGYTNLNVARCWKVETGVLVDTELPNGNFQTYLLNFQLSEMIVDYYVYELIFLWDASREVIVVQM